MSQCDNGMVFASGAVSRRKKGSAHPVVKSREEGQENGGKNIVWFLIDLLIAMLIVSGALYGIGWAIAKVMEGRK